MTPAGGAPPPVVVPEPKPRPEPPKTAPLPERTIDPVIRARVKLLDQTEGLTLAQVEAVSAFISELL